MKNLSTTYDDTTQNYYTQMLLNGLPDTELKVQDIPLIINTVDVSYPFAFIDYEEDNILGVNYTSEDGTERFVVINKKYIVDIEVLYEQDINIKYYCMDTEDIDNILIEIVKEFVQPENYTRIIDEQVLANAIFYSFAVGALNNDENEYDTIQSLFYVINWIEDNETILKGFKLQGDNDA